MSSQDLRERLKKDIGVEEWVVMRPHFWRGALILLEESLELIEVGEAVAQDDHVKVQEWIQSGLLKKPDEDQAKKWEIEKARFDFLIVQPYVLVKPVA